MDRPNKETYWIASQLFYPNETSTAFVMTNIAEYVLDIGTVNVICGAASYQSDALNNATGIDDRIIIHRINTYVNKNNLFLMLFGSVILSFKIAWKILKSVKKDDKLILVTNPPMLVLFASAVKRFKKFKMVILIHDVFPENLSVTGVIKKSSLSYKILLKMFNSAYNQANHLVACGSDMRDVFLQKVKTPPISVVTNWADHLEIFNKSKTNISSYYNLDLKNKIVLQFAGNIGRVQGLDRFIELFMQLKNSSLFVVILGDGVFKEKIVALTRKFDQKNILFVSSKPRSEQNDFLNACDIGLVTLREGMYGLGVPSKVYNIFSAGKPVLYIGDSKSEIYNYINEYNIGWAFTWDQIAEIKVFLESLDSSKRPIIEAKGKAARQVVNEKFTKDYVLDQYGKIFTSV
jgi:glycosyltransferase involved in cell wall biosynthesis